MEGVREGRGGDPEEREGKERRDKRSGGEREGRKGQGSGDEKEGRQEERGGRGGKAREGLEGRGRLHTVWP